MGFKVIPEGLENFAAQVERAAEDASRAKTYVEKYANVDLGGELWTLAKNAHEKTTSTLYSRLRQANDAFVASGSELRATGGYYRAADQTSAQEIDATLPASEQCTPSQLSEDWLADPCRPQVGAYSDVQEPLDRLVPIEEPDYSHPLAFLDNISAHIGPTSPLPRCSDSTPSPR